MDLNTIIEEEKKTLNLDAYRASEGGIVVPYDTAIDILTTAMQRAIKAERVNWLRSEIEKLEGMAMKNTKDESTSDWFYGYGWNHALTSIITRYKEELEVLESK